MFDGLGAHRKLEKQRISAPPSARKTPPRPAQNGFTEPTDADNPDAACAARAKALAAYLAYRHDGGENHSTPGRIALAVGEQLGNGQAQAAEAELRASAAHPNTPEQAGPYLSCLSAIAQGRRDPVLAETAGLSYDQAAEILLLIERLPPAADELGARGLPRRLFRRWPAGQQALTASLPAADDPLPGTALLRDGTEEAFTVFGGSALAPALRPRSRHDPSRGHVGGCGLVPGKSEPRRSRVGDERGATRHRIGR